MGNSWKKNTAVSGILPELLQHKGWRVKLEMHSFFPKWKEVVGDSVSQCSRPLKIVKDILWLEVESSAWMQQLQYQKYQILDDINATLHHSRIRDVKFVLPAEREQESKFELPEVTFVPPDPEALEQFEKQALIIEDKATRESLVRLYYLSKACRRGRKSED